MILKSGDRDSGDVMPTIEPRLRQELRNYAVELRQLAYTLPHGVGEHDLLLLSDRMRDAAEQMVRKGPSGQRSAAALEANLPAHEQKISRADCEQHAHVEPPSGGIVVPV